MTTKTEGILAQFEEVAQLAKKAQDEADNIWNVPRQVHPNDILEDREWGQNAVNYTKVKAPGLILTNAQQDKISSIMFPVGIALGVLGVPWILANTGDSSPWWLVFLIGPVLGFIAGLILWGLLSELTFRAIRSVYKVRNAQSPERARKTAETTALIVNDAIAKVRSDSEKATRNLGHAVERLNESLRESGSSLTVSWDGRHNVFFK